MNLCDYILGLENEMNHLIVSGRMFALYPSLSFFPEAVPMEAS